MKNIRYVFGSFFPDSLLTLPMASRGGIYECNKGSVVKKTLTSIMAVATMLNLCSCSQEFIDTPESKKAIVFNDVQTRETVSSADDIRRMGVFAQMNLGDIDKGEAGSNSYIMLLENERVSRDDYPSAPWTYEHTRYWVADRKYHFFAVWPYSSGDNSPVTNVKSVVGSSAYSYSLTFETPEKADQDLLTAVSGAITTKTGVAFPEAVGLNFQRELSNVNLKIWSNGAPDNVKDKIRVKEVTISSVTQTGTLTKTVGNDSSWKHSSTKTSFTKNYGDGITVSQAQIIDGELVPNPVSEYNEYNDRPGVPFDGGLLLIPHTISNSAPVIVTVIYDLQRPIDAEEGKWERKKLQAFLPEGTWPAGKKLTYNLVISGERTITEFQINTVVEDWITQTDEIDFTQGVTVTDKMNWVEGYQSWNREKGEVVLYTDEEKVAVCEFNISTPIGATWTASLIPLTASAMDAFSIVEDSKYGDVGTDVMQKVKIKINSTAPIAARAECLLRITVQTSDGRTIVVKDLMPDGTEKGIEEFKIIKNLING